MSKEAMKLALEALEMYLIETNSQFQRSAVTALREALAEQPAQQEPVAWPIETNNHVEALAKQCGWDNRRYMTPADYQIWCDRMRQFVQLASPPAQRTWVGLTDEEMHDCWDSPLTPLGMKHARIIEAKLREKNT